MVLVERNKFVTSLLFSPRHVEPTDNNNNNNKTNLIWRLASGSECDQRICKISLQLLTRVDVYLFWRHPEREPSLSLPWRSLAALKSQSGEIDLSASGARSNLKRDNNNNNSDNDNTQPPEGAILRERCRRRCSGMARAIGTQRARGGGNKWSSEGWTVLAS